MMPRITDDAMRNAMRPIECDAGDDGAHPNRVDSRAETAHTMRSIAGRVRDAAKSLQLDVQIS